jgi:hypothetical protein
LDEIIYIGKSVSGGVQIIFISGRLYWVISYNTINLLPLLWYRLIQTLRLRTRIKQITIMMTEAQTPYMIFITLGEADVAIIERLWVKLCAWKLI